MCRPSPTLTDSTLEREQYEAGLVSAAADTAKPTRLLPLDALQNQASQAGCGWFSSGKTQASRSSTATTTPGLAGESSNAGAHADLLARVKRLGVKALPTPLAPQCESQELDEEGSHTIPSWIPRDWAHQESQADGVGLASPQSLNSDNASRIFDNDGGFEYYQDGFELQGGRTLGEQQMNEQLVGQAKQDASSDSSWSPMPLSSSSSSPQSSSGDPVRTCTCLLYCALKELKSSLTVIRVSSLVNIYFIPDRVVYKLAMIERRWYQWWLCQAT